MYSERFYMSTLSASNIQGNINATSIAVLNTTIDSNGISTNRPLLVTNTGSLAFFNGSSATFNGITISATDASASNFRSSYIDYRNESNVPVAALSTDILTNGATTSYFTLTPPGSRTSDRRRTATVTSVGSNSSAFGVYGASGGNRGEILLVSENDTATSESYIVVYHKPSSGSGSWYLGFQYFNGSTVVTLGSISQSGTTGVAYNTTSDYRLKTNPAPIQSSTDTLMKLKPCTYTWKGDGSEGIGFIAHELQEHFPSAVTGIKDEVDEKGEPKYQGVDFSRLVPLLTAALQESNKKIEELTKRIEVLESK